VAKAYPKAEPIAEAATPPELRQALAVTPAAEAAWADLTPIGRRDFVRWINTAKQAETRQRRIAVAIDKLTRGERRPCCYNVMPLDLHLALKAEPAAKTQWATLTGDEKRDWFDWIESAEGKAERKIRVDETCARLTAGKRQP
jgi:uncharacterized protein YdeI (YjbR/CyaY-like superfamily)